MGDIAKKAYLPVISKLKVEVHLFTRNPATLSLISDHYRFNNVHQTLQSLISSGIQGAFVHSATASHDEIVEQLLSNNINVYVDKPITYHFDSSEKLMALAKKKNLMLKVGFNRRYAPAYVKLKDVKSPNMIIMQKNRYSLPADIRTFIFDDFIHVIDTLLFLSPYPIEDLFVTGRKIDGLLYHVVIQLFGKNGFTAVGVMNRDSGTVEEKLEVFGSDEKRVVYNVSDLVIHQNKNETLVGGSDWEPMLLKRGFEQIIEEFLKSLQVPSTTDSINDQTLLTHKICEDVVQKLNEI